jgi:hypothetical protein
MSLLNGFLSLFDWMFPSKNYQELSEELDEKMQDLYDKNRWGKYTNPLTRSISSDEWNSFIDYEPGPFVPYSFYDEYTDSLTAHFKDGEYVAIVLNDNITVFKSFYNGEVIGCRINNLKKTNKGENNERHFTK